MVLETATGKCITLYTGTDKACRIYENPSLEQLESLSHEPRFAGFRYLKGNDGEVYVWSAILMTHLCVAKELGIRLPDNHTHGVVISSPVVTYRRIKDMRSETADTEIALERNNLGKKASIMLLDAEIKSFNDKEYDDLPGHVFMTLPGGYSVRQIEMVQGLFVLDATGFAVGGIGYNAGWNYAPYWSLSDLKLSQEAQGKGLILQVIDRIIQKMGGAFSSNSLSPGATKVYLALSKKYHTFAVWPFHKTYTEISSWKPVGIYSAFPHILAPNEKEYPIDKLEQSLRSFKNGYAFGELFVSKSGKPPKGYTLLGGGPRVNKDSIDD